MDTSELDRTQTDRSATPAAGGAARGGAIFRGLSGAVSLGLVVLTLVVLGAQLLASANNVEGPGVSPVVGHLAASAISVTCQRMADRRSGLASVLGSLAVFAVAGAALWTFWWA